MSGPSSPAGADVHERIEQQAVALRRLPAIGFDDVERQPELKGFLEEVRRLIFERLPANIEYRGRTYWIGQGGMLDISVYDAAGAATPMIRVLATLTGGGHRPGH